MPPRMKSHRCNKTCSLTCKNPRVILKPLLADSSGHGRYRFTSLPASSNLYNKPELSDISITVGENKYYAHKLILCSASEVFKNMLDGRWSENKKNDLVLDEEEECVKYFDRFLQYMYTGSIVISESYVIPLFMLADKYNVKPLYSECVKIIETGLKVYLIRKNPGEGLPVVDSTPVKFLAHSSASTNSSSSGESSDSDFSESDGPTLSQGEMGVGSGDGAGTSTGQSKKSSGNAHATLYLVASEIFPLSMVMKMLLFCHNDKIHHAALYNLEARLSKQISNENYGVWNDIEESLIIKMLKDTYFFCKEFTLFKAIKAWLQYNAVHLKDTTKSDLLCLIRYPTLTPDELYLVEKDQLVCSCPSAKELVAEAIRFQLFRDCCTVKEEQWKSEQFHPRMVREEL